MEALKGKKVLVTGGANGIGREIVNFFCRAEAIVAFCDIDKKAGEKLEQELSIHNCRFIHANVSQKSDVINLMEGLFSLWNDIDIIINNVGIGLFAPIEDIDIEDFERVININLRTAFITSKMLAEQRSKNNNALYGRIINIASTRYLMSEPNSEAYAASKGGLVSLTHALAASLAKYKITINCISPGWIENGDYSKLSQTDHLQHFSGRVGLPADIARYCIFLCQPENDFINGQNIVIDGGMTKKMIYTE
ncbi:SDR family oxidoreductase [Dysgonomonas sp. 216]|uniref:SDR family NAD(P)-dependent oxidoreductase n=1 Tax=Dysgonomonas sp. 216 TaxID=2302934 RepID=UPI0013D70265|nr:SDR family oxidoreductase [Dysgonomonas sp. 216]NDW18023.1 SDR family oxidoreductase [Dysgonomonas sp. 216]